jgi:DNA polymerase V
MFGVIDANNFFASCERVFRPDLAYKPVVVLSSNDGCVVARSQEVRNLGVPMGIPYFKIKDQLTKAGVEVFSSNFGLYSDMSQRMQTIIAASVPRAEVYSVDEAFVDLSHLQPDEIDNWAYSLRQQIGQCIGLPVSIGIASSKTLAKIASEHAKHHTNDGIYKLAGSDHNVLKQIKLGDIWGVGRRLSPKLEKIGLKTAYDLSQMDHAYARALMGKKGLQTVLELNGQSCIPLEISSKPPKSILVSRSFGHRVRQIHEIETATASFIARASAKLRRYHLRAGAVALNLRGVKDDENWFSNTYSPLVQASSDTAVLAEVALALLNASFEPDISYKKAGILLFNFSSDKLRQSDLFLPETHQTDRRRNLMRALDQINRRYGSDTLQLAVQSSKKQAWQPRSERRSPDFTRSWQNLPLVF